MQETPTVVKPLNFSKDIEFFDYLVDSKLKMYELFIMKPLSAKRETTQLNDKVLDELVNDISQEMLASLSEHYKQVLLQYFNEEALETFVTERVFFHIYEQGIMLNMEKISKMRSSTFLAKANTANQ